MAKKWTEEQREVARRRFRERQAAKEAVALEGAPLGDGAGALREEVAAAPEPMPDAAAAARRRKLLADMSPDMAALITDDELAEIEREEVERALAEQKKQALAGIRSRARQYARIEHELVPGDVLRSEEERRRLAEPVRIKIDLPEGAGLGIRVDGRLFRHGEETTVTRAEFESLQYTFYKTHLEEIRFAELNQNRPGNSAKEILHRRRPTLEVIRAA